MRVTAIKMVWPDGDQAVTWRTGNTLCATFYAGSLQSVHDWLPVETHKLTERDQGKDILTLAREMWRAPRATIMLV